MPEALRALALLCAAGGAWANSPEDTLVVGPDGTLGVSADGKPARFLLVANGGFHPILNPATAQRLQLRPDRDRHAAFALSPQPVRRSELDIAVGGRGASHYVYWFDRVVAAAHDGLLGPSGVPHRVVTFRLRAAAPGEQLHVFPLTDVHDDAVDEIDAGSGTFVKVGADRVFVQWDLTRDRALATAATAASLADANGVRARGPRRTVPVGMEVAAPVEGLTLDTPFVLGPLSIDQVDARVNDAGANTAPANQPCSGDIVVTAPRAKVAPVRALLVGRDAMARCSRLTFDKRRGEIILSCRAA